MHRRGLLLLCALSTSLVGCKDKPAPAPSEQPVASASAHVNEAPIDSPKRLALADSRGSANVDRQILFLQNAAKKEENKPDAWIMLGRAWVRKARESGDPGFYLNASASADMALAVSPDNYLARDLKALVLLNNHDFDGARALAQKIVDQRPDDAMGYGTLSDALLELGRFDEAAAAAQKMLDLKPNLPAYSRSSYFRWLQGDTERAKEFARRAIDAGAGVSDPEPRAWEIVQSAHIFWHEGDYEGSEAGCDLALKSIGDYPAALAAKGRAALSRGDAKRAAELLTRAFAGSPLPETAWLLGDARQLAGDAKGADEAYAHIEKDGRTSDPRTLSLFWSTKNKNATEALALAEAEKKVRGDIATDDALAWALYRNRRFADAKTASDRALVHGTKDARMIFHAGAIRIALGDKAGKKMIRDALALNPHFDVSGEAEARALVGGDAVAPAK
jgi:tetratricopeptide (TPR) repeat protein